MTLRFLGTGSSLGTPMIGCRCAACTSADPRDRRLRSSVWVETGGKKILIDPGPDFRQQCLQYGITRVDAYLITHPHRDHIGGMDDVRAVYYAMDKKPLEIYAEDFSIRGLHKYYDYLFPPDGVRNYHAAPVSRLHTIEAGKAFRAAGVRILPLRVWHGDMPVTGYRIGKLLYLTDVKSIPPETKRHIDGETVLVLGVLQREPHALHMHLEQALDFVAGVRPARTYLTHIGHRMGTYAELSKALPPGVFMAYDGLEIEI